jgi:hypothetical protein
MQLLDNVQDQQLSIVLMELNGQLGAINVFIVVQIQCGILLLVHVFNVQVGIPIIQYHKCVFQVIQMVQLSLKIALKMLLIGMEIHVYSAIYQVIGTMIQADVKTVHLDFILMLIKINVINVLPILSMISTNIYVSIQFPMVIQQQL